MASWGDSSTTSPRRCKRDTISRLTGGHTPGAPPIRGAGGGPLPASDSEDEQRCRRGGGRRARGCAGGAPAQTRPAYVNGDPVGLWRSRCARYLRRARSRASGAARARDGAGELLAVGVVAGPDAGRGGCCGRRAGPLGPSDATAGPARAVCVMGPGVGLWWVGGLWETGDFGVGGYISRGLVWDGGERGRGMGWVGGSRGRGMRRDGGGRGYRARSSAWRSKQFSASTIVSGGIALPAKVSNSIVKATATARPSGVIPSGVG